MLFSSMIFLWLFLPVVFIGYRLLDKRYKNLFLLIASLLFYAWGEPRFILIMLTIIAINYIFGILIDKEDILFRKKIYLAVSILINLSFLGYFKYYNFFAQNVNRLLGEDFISIRNIVLPIGISFYTFQALSYVIDLYRKEIPVQKNIFDLALYISFFPQLIAGPIIKYRDVQKQMQERALLPSKTAYGIKRFIYGLTKKVLLANTFAQTADRILSADMASLSTLVVWFGMILYTLQIYYDFSGYSDMAIGLGKMFGFDFLENFNYPYIAASIRDFWRRWHISLSTWFKEYVYIPLGGNREGKARTYLNLIIVFLATGLWHGASFNFIVWGLYYGFFLVIERMFLGRWLDKNKFKFLNHIYTILVVVTGWVFFRAEGMRHAFNLLKVMFIPKPGTVTILTYADAKLIILLISGILLCGILQKLIKKLFNALYNQDRGYIMENAVMFILLFIDIILLINNTYNPFIYFRF